MIRFSIIILFLTFSAIAKSQLLPPQITVVDGELIIDAKANKRYYDIKEALKNPDSVKILVLQGQNIKELPKSITKFKNLEELYLGYIQGIGYIETNNFSEFPKEIFELKKLKILQLNNNQITEIPEEIKKLESLQTLELFGNPIKKFPVSLYELPKLEYLDLGNTEIRVYPEDIYKLKNLKVLDLSFSKSKRLPESFGKLKHLERLDLSMSNFNKLPNSLGSCEKIAHLDLFGTNSIDLEETFEIIKDIDSLKWIHLNEIKELPKNISEFKNLETLFINNDKYPINYSQLLTRISEIKTLKSLLIYNEIGSDWIIPDEIGLCTQLIKLEFYHSNKYYEFTISTEIQKLTKLKQFSHIDRIDNYNEIKNLLPSSCYIH